MIDSLRMIPRLAVWLCALLAAILLIWFIIYHRFPSLSNSNENALRKEAIESLNLENVLEIRASLTDLRDSMGISLPPISEFTIINEYCPVILKSILPAKEFSYPSSWDDIVFGRITILTKTRGTVRVAFCNAGKNPLCYSVGSTHFIRGGLYRPVLIDEREEYYKDEGTLLYNIIREIYKEQTTRQKNSRISELIDELDRSIGDKPPMREKQTTKEKGTS